MRTDRIKIAILFTSKMDGVWSNDEKRNAFMNSDLLSNGETCLLYLCKDKEPKWVTTLSDVPLRPTYNTKHFMIIMAIDEVSLLPT